MNWYKKTKTARKGIIPVFNDLDDALKDPYKPAIDEQGLPLTLLKPFDQDTSPMGGHDYYDGFKNYRKAPPPGYKLRDTEPGGQPLGSDSDGRDSDNNDKYQLMTDGFAFHGPDSPMSREQTVDRLTSGKDFDNSVIGPLNQQKFHNSNNFFENIRKRIN